MDTETSIQEQSGGTETTGTEQVEQTTEQTTEQPVSGDKYEALLKRLDGLESANRAFQSEKDVAIKRAKEAEEKAKLLERTLDGVKGKYQDDPDFTSTLDRERQSNELRYYKDRDEAIKADQQRARQHQEFVSVTNELIKELGVDPGDKRLAEAAVGATSYPDLQRRLIAKAKEISKGGSKTVLKDEIAQLREDLKAELRKEMGLDSEANIPPVGNSGKVYTSESVAKMSQEDYEKNEAEILKAIQEGRFKR